MALDWAVQTFGSPCRECGFNWDIDADAAIELVSQLPARYRTLAEGATGQERHPDLLWNFVQYVSHVVDNLRISGERLVGVAETGQTAIAGYDPDALAIARRYDLVKLPAALWSLDYSVAAWLEAVAFAQASGLVMQHETRGEQTPDDVTIANAHDAFHHAWDLERILAG